MLSVRLWCCLSVHASVRVSGFRSIKLKLLQVSSPNFLCSCSTTVSSLGLHIVARVRSAVATCTDWGVRTNWWLAGSNINLIASGDDRGPVLEVIVSRTNFISSHTERIVRVVGLSTALANARDLADWLGIKQVTCS